MKRSLIMLLVVALLSTLLVPAMAEGAAVTPKLVSISLSSTDYKDFLYRGQVSGADSWPAEGTNFIDVISQVEGEFIPVIFWSSSDEDIAEAINGGYQECRTGKDEIPRLNAKKAGSIVLTGDVYEQKDAYTKYDKLATLTLNVNIELVKETAVEFATKAFKVRAGRGVNVAYDYEKMASNVTVKPDGEKGSTYSEADLLWSVSDPSIITVNKNGFVSAVDSDREEKVTAEVYATAKGDPNVKGTATITVYPKIEDPDAPALKSINFSTKAFEAESGDYYAVWIDNYLTIEPTIAKEDLVWSSSNPNLAKVRTSGYWTTEYEYDDDGNIIDEYERYVSENWVAVTDAAKPGDVITITAASKTNPDVKDSFTVKIIEPKGYEKLAFTQESIKIKGERVSLYDYLDYEYNDNDELVWTSSDPDAVRVYNGQAVMMVPEKEATITVRAKMNPDKVFASIKVTFEKGKLEGIEFTKDLPKTLEAFDVVDLWKYINTTPWYYTLPEFCEDIEWTSSDARVAEVEYDYDWEEDEAYCRLYTYMPGKVTLTATSKSNPEIKKTIELEVTSVPATKITFASETYTVKVDGLPINLRNDGFMKFEPANCNEPAITAWSSDNDEIATVDDNGIVYGHKAGTAVITVLARNLDGTPVEGKVTVKVEKADNELTSFTFKKTEFKAEVGKHGYDGYEAWFAIDEMVKLTPADGTYSDWSKFDFYSSNQEVAEFDRVAIGGDGEAYFVFKTYKPGTVTLIGQSRLDEALKAETTLTVEPIKVKKIARPTKFKSIDMPLYDVDSEEDPYQVNFKDVHVNVTPAYAYYETKWETSDASVAYVVDEDGNEARIKAVAPGTCKIQVTVTDGTNTFTRDMFVTVKAAKVTKLALNRSKVNAYIIKGAENTFQLTATDAKTGYEVPVKWTSSDAKVAKVYQSGKVKFLTAGTAKITATTKDGNKVSKTCTFTVKKLAVTEVKPASKSVTIKVGGEKTLKAKVKPAKAFNTALYFKSSDTKVVAVDQDGVVLGLKPGKATITITARDGSKKSATITVYVKAVTAANDGELEVLDGDLAIEGELLENSFDIDVAGEEIVIADDEAVELSVD